MGILDWFRKKDPKDAFADRFRRALIKAGETRPIRYDKDEFSLNLGPNQILFLKNAYDEYVIAPPSLQEQTILRYTILRGDVDIPKLFQEALPSLIPRVRERYFCSSILLTLEAEGRRLPDFAFKPLTDHFAVELAYDLPQQSMQVMQHQLDEWNVSLEDALRQAHENLRRRTAGPMKQIRPGLYVSTWNDTYSPSRLLMPEYLAGHEVKGELVAIAANRDLLFLTGSKDEEGLEEMARRTDQARSQPRFMSGTALIWSEGQWSPFTPEPDQSSYADLLMLRQMSMAGSYEDQKASLDKIHEGKGIDIFVASISLVQNKETNQIRSYCVWVEDVDSLLPQADDVAFLRANPSGDPQQKLPAIVVPWAAVRSRLSHLMTPVDGYPIRYRVQRFPAPEVLREIGKEM